MSRPANFNKVYPSQGTAICTQEQARRLVDYDHHRVLVDGKPAVLLTVEWLALEEHRGPFVLTVVFHHADQHPPAPPEVQSLVDELKFQFRSQPR
jgi:hypothetical protein